MRYPQSGHTIPNTDALNRVGSGRTAGREAVKRGLVGGRFKRPANRHIVYYYYYLSQVFPQAWTGSFPSETTDKCWVDPVFLSTLLLTQAASLHTKHPPMREGLPVHK